MKIIDLYDVAMLPLVDIETKKKIGWDEVRENMEREVLAISTNGEFDILVKLEKGE